MKVGLNVLDRLMLLESLPRQGDIVTAKTVHDLRMRLAFTDDEQEKLEFKVRPEGGVNWNPKAAEEMGEVEFEFAARTQRVIREALVGLDKEKKLTPQHVSIYDKFVPDEDEDNAK